MTGYVGWTSSPDYRGTLGLLHSSGATILLCSYNAIHLNVPGNEETELVRRFRQVRWMLLAIVIPELVALHAAQQLFEAQWLTKKVQEIVKGERAEAWNLIHSYYVVMGGFDLHFADKQKPYRLITPQFLGLLEEGTIDLPSISVKDIKDKSKVDMLAQALLVVQLTWYITALIARAAEGLPISPLEHVTLGIVFCTFFHIFAWFRKPRDVGVPTPIEVDCKREDLIGFLTGYARGYDWAGIRVSDTEHMGREQTGSTNALLALAPLPSLVFGAAGILSWHSHFPTSVEKKLFRISSVCVFVLPLLMLALSVSSHHRARLARARGEEKPDTTIHDILIIVVFLVYCVFRLYTFVQILLYLRSAPAALYKDVNYSAILPHIGG